MDAYPEAGPDNVGLAETVERAWQSPFFARKLRAAGLDRGQQLDWMSWRGIAPTTKDELRELSPFEAELSASDRSEVLEYWRSGGVTGLPLHYPRTAIDLETSSDAFTQALSFAGVRSDDVFLCSLPLGLHPAGQQMLRAAQSLGAATLWAGAGNQTPSATQVRLIEEMGVTVWCGMPSFALHLAHVAEGNGRLLSESSLRTLITTAEPLTPGKRTMLEAVSGAQVVDTFGMSEVTLFGVECRASPGLHVSTRHVFCEVLDPDTLRPVSSGATGVLCVTPVLGRGATPFLRWLSGDVVRMEFGCDCARADEPRMVHSGRTNAFFKAKGVNINHAEVEEAFFRTVGLKDYLVAISADDRLCVDLECLPESASEVGLQVGQLFAEQFGIRAVVSFVERGSIASRLEGQVKPQRFVDLRLA